MWLPACGEDNLSGKGLWCWKDVIEMVAFRLSATAGKDNEETVRVGLLKFVKILILEQGCIKYI
jgi:hypothetical protein